MEEQEGAAVTQVEQRKRSIEQALLARMKQGQQGENESWRAREKNNEEKKSRGLCLETIGEVVDLKSKDSEVEAIVGVALRYLQ